MKTLLSIKRLAENIPYSIGKFTSYVPYSWRLGSTYSHYAGLLPPFENANPGVRLEYVVKQLDAIVQYAQKNIPFYQELYGRDRLRIGCLADFEALPVISRDDVRGYTRMSSGAYLLNTGGSTGGPLSFYVDRNVWAREWAHMHYIWSRRHYRPADLMATMMGKPLPGMLSRYNAVHNEYLLDPYSPMEAIAQQFIRLLRARPVRFFQGYPSNIYNVFKAAEEFIEPVDRKGFASTIRCLLFSSEYPSEHMVDYLSKEWGISDYLSWYGHSEMCLLACDFDSTYDYHPLYTYGYAEEQDGMLIGTSFHNYDMPLIRYKTEDLVSSTKDGVGLISSFKVTGGRSSDFIEDKKGQNHSLTFFLGRHHAIYNFADFIQIYQARPGQVTYYIVLSRGFDPGESDLRSFFDIPHKLDVEFEFRLIDKPVRTKGGKLKIKLTNDDIRSLEQNMGLVADGGREDAS